MTAHRDLVFPLPRPLRTWDPDDPGPDEPTSVILPGWVRDAHPTATGWTPAGDRRWRATTPGPFGTPETLLLVIGTSGAASGTVDTIEPYPDKAIALIFEKLQAKVDYADLPPCVATDCDRKGPVEATAAEFGHFAGVMYAPGDPIRLCHPHLADVLAASDGRPLDQMAAWLRPDAEDLDDTLTAASSAGRLGLTRPRPWAPLPRPLRPSAVIEDTDRP